MEPKSTRQPGLEATRWSLFQELQDAEAAGDQAALPELLDQVLAIYRVPLHNHLLWQMRLSPADADDVLQEFLLAKNWLRDLIERANRGKGRFRSLLLVSLQNFVRDWWAKKGAQKELPNKVGAEAAFEFLPEAAAPDAYDTDAARAVLREAIIRMRSQCKPERWRLFCRQVLVTQLYGLDPLSGKDAATTLGFRDAREVDSVLVNCKRMFRKALQAVVAEYAHDEEDIARELAELRQALAKYDGRTLDLPPAIQRELDQFLLPQHTTGTYRTLLSHLFLAEEEESDGAATLRTSLEALFRMRLADLAPNLPREAESSGSRTVGDLLTASKAPLEALRVLKDVGRNWIEERRSPEQAWQGALLYFSAIAAADVNWQQRISQSSDSRLAQGVERLLVCDFLPPELSSLLRTFAQRLHP